MGEDALQFDVGPDLAHDVARDPAEISADRLQCPVGALELSGVGIALMGDQRVFADSRIPLVLSLDSSRRVSLIAICRLHGFAAFYQMEEPPPT